jgi:polar amino acid transport system substrate-binding protein
MVRFGLVSEVVVIAVCAISSSAAFAADRPLRVATGATAPFVLPNTDPPAGFSIDLWREVASRMGVEFSWSVIAAPPERLQPELLQAVERRDADVAISAIVLANVIWLIERRHNIDFQKPYWRAIGEGLWGTMLVIATGEHGGRDTGALKRVTVVMMWLVGVVLIAQLTATVTSSQTVERLQSSIQGPNDLPGKTIGTVPGSVAAEYLSQLGLPYVAVTSTDDGIRMLMQREVQGIVFDAPTLQYWAAKRGNGMLKVVGPIFRPEKYGIVVADGSALRKPINKALLSIYEDGTYENLYARWFSRGDR